MNELTNEYLILDQDLRMMRDDLGRPLGEHKIPKELRQGVPFKYAKCPFTGSRHMHKKLMNVSAFEDVNRSWPKICNTLLDLRAHFCGDVENVKFSLIELFNFIDLGCHIARLSILKSKNGRAEMTSVQAGIYKTLIGLRSVCRITMYRSLIANPNMIFMHFPSTNLHEIIETDQHLIGQKGVCAAPNEMIFELVELCNSGKTTFAPEADQLVSNDDFKLMTEVSLIHKMRHFLGLIKGVALLNLSTIDLSIDEQEVKKALLSFIALMPKADMQVLVKNLLNPAHISLWDVTTNQSIHPQTIVELNQFMVRATAFQTKVEIEKNYLQTLRKLIELTQEKMDLKIVDQSALIQFFHGQSSLV